MDMIEILRFVSALIFVVALMGGLALILKRFGVNGGYTSLTPQKRRLHRLEMLTLDSNHKAVLFRCDDKEHLVILGTTSQTVVQTIKRSSDDPV